MKPWFLLRDPRNYYKNTLFAFSTLLNGTGFQKFRSLRPGGRILDKFKLALRDGILTTISQAYRNDNCPAIHYWKTLICDQELMGSLELAEETLYATNFDGNYAYIVTFLQTDPLFVIDLSNPYHQKSYPNLSCQDGRNTFNHWETNFLPLAWKTVWWPLHFDLSDKSNFLSDRIYLGDEDGYLGARQMRWKSNWALSRKIPFSSLPKLERNGYKNNPNSWNPKYKTCRREV